MVLSFAMSSFGHDQSSASREQNDCCCKDICLWCSWADALAVQQHRFKMDNTSLGLVQSYYRTANFLTTMLLVQWRQHDKIRQGDTKVFSWTSVKRSRRTCGMLEPPPPPPPSFLPCLTCRAGTSGASVRCFTSGWHVTLADDIAGGFQTPPTNGFGGSGFNAPGMPNTSPYSTSSQSSAYPSPPITPPQQTFQAAPNASTQAGAQTPTTPPTAGPAAFGPSNITTPYGGSGPALLAKKDASLHDPFADLTGLKPSNAPKVAPSIKAQAPMGGGMGGAAGGAPTSIAAFQGFSPGSSGFNSPAQQNSFTAGQSGFNPQQSGFNPQQGGFNPSHSGFNAPQSGFGGVQQQGGFPVYMGSAQNGFAQNGFGGPQQQMGGYAGPQPGGFGAPTQQPPRPHQPQAGAAFPTAFTASGSSLI